MQVFTDDGARIDVRIDGERGVPVVLLAGFPLTREIWDVQAAALSETHRVIRPDLRGMGSSGVTDGPYLMETLACDVAAALDKLGIERVALAGHSLGGYVALAFARMFTERLTHFAMICSRLSPDLPQVAANRFELADRVERDASMEPVIEAYGPRLFASENYERNREIVEKTLKIARTVNPKGAAAMLRGMAMRDDAHDIAPDVDVPMLTVAGGADRIVALEESRGIADAFPQGCLEVCERSGHLPMAEEPGRLSELLGAWLARPPAT